MSKTWGYVLVPHESYLAWKTATNGNGWDVDSTYGCQCWDLASLFWYNVGFPTLYPHLTGIDAYTMWDKRVENASYNGVTYFDFVYNVNDIKQGDVIVFNYTQSNPAGHVGFADVDYSSWVPDPNQPFEFPILSENNQGTTDLAGGSYANIHGYDIRLFLGAFRYREWVQPTHIVHRKVTKKHFPWVLYARKLRGER